jgi:predicted dehydrogenase
VPERLQLAHRHPDVRCFASLSDVSADLSLDAALIATPPSSHAPIAREAIARGLAVLIEKPMALDADEARLLASSAREAGAIVRVGFNRRFRRNYVELRDRVARLPATALESLRYVWLADAARWSPTLDADGELGALEQLVHDVGSHQADLFAWLTGQRIVGIEALTKPAGASQGDTLEYLATFEDGLAARGLVGYGERYRERVRVVAAGRILSASPGGLLRVPSRAKGYLDLVERPLEVAHLGWSRLRRRPSITAESFLLQLDAFADAVSRTPTPSTAADMATEEDGLGAVLAAEACLRSMKSGRVEAVES